MSKYLFVYGSLRSGFTPTEVQPSLNGITLISPATVRGWLYDLGEYSGVQLAEDGGLVVGELLEMSDAPTQLRVLDSYEGIDEHDLSQCLFVRTKCRTALPDGQSVEAWIYVYNQSLTNARLIESGDYAEVARRPLETEAI
ncbi:MAG: gamma-glutamylcyclotransferase [Acidobacteria bacterium]|nr:gamma-glutamylcyclotransferase [Acidobacteriota bacterium]MBI3426188.1 gamma-glutamylcyclotransferase [Acidobacteriota bacterium]